MIADHYGYNRIPAFWFTLNLPFNYLYEIHRFQRATDQINRERVSCESIEDTTSEEVDCLDSVSKEAMEKRCNWVLNNPDIVVLLHVIRVEVIVNYVMKHIVPADELQSFCIGYASSLGKAEIPMHTD